LRIDARPPSAEISVDGILVARGSWEGRLPQGSHHVGVELAGYEPFARKIDLEQGGPEVVVPAILEVPLGARSHLAVEVSAGAVVGLFWGGDLTGGCSGGCSAGIPTGGQGQIHLVYRTPAGLGVGLEAGYFRVARSIEGRSQSFSPVRLDDPGQ